MAGTEKYFIGPKLLGEIRRVVRRVEAEPVASEVARIPTRLQDMPRNVAAAAGIQRVTFTGAWNKNTIRIVAGSGAIGTVSVSNVFATIDAGCGEPRKGAIALIDGVWHLIAAECA